MCTTCGCSDDAPLRLTRMLDRSAPHEHAPHRHVPQSTQTKRLEQDILGRNDRSAATNRSRFAGQGILALNLLSSPGSGKTSLLERTLTDRARTWPMSVIEGDQHTLNDARRIRATGAAAVQLNTGAGCHLEAEMVGQALDELQAPPHSIVFIENVGNLVCPALFDLGEHCKVVLLSVTEGDDKPLKYPHMFRAASLMIINKTDLLPYVDFSIQACVAAARQVNPQIQVMQVSAKTGEGFEDWYQWLDAQRSRPAPDRAPLRIGRRVA